MEYDVEYVEEDVITGTFGCLAVAAVGDCDNDGMAEINAGSVWTISEDQPYKEWIFKYGYENPGNRRRCWIIIRFLEYY